MVGILQFINVLRFLSHLKCVKIERLILSPW